ncbi:MAG TPA: hypothetical protein VNJ70_17915 [Thermoanaerobaculia bacterium]|nr:hypothetical protein [Thermoanaerobaculia bacterium]
MKRTEADWLGLTIRSESDQPHEWLPIGWTIRNRVLTGRYGNFYEAVVLSRKQFSYFNQFAALVGDHEALFEAALKGYAGDMVGWAENNLDKATACARELMAAPRWHAPFGTDVMHYYSPISMVPKNAKPPWLRQAKLLLIPSGIDPQRFVFAAGVP